MTSRRSRRISHFAVLVVSTLILLSSGLWAQSFRGSIRGTVSDQTGAVIVGAKVTVKNASTGFTRDVLTGPDGSYVVPELSAGSYRVAAESKGFQVESLDAVVNVGLDTSLNFQLGVAGAMIDREIVTAQVPLVETTRDVLGQVVNERLVTELPLNGRDFGKLVALTPGTTVDPSGVAGTQGGFGQFNVNGNRDRSNNYALDGTDNNDPYFNNSALNQTGIGGAPGSLLPIDAIAEFNLQSQFGAEYGRNSGSVVNIITRSGTNLLHGTAFEFLRNSALDARNFFNSQPKKSVFQNNSFGGSLGGPVVKDKTFFFAAYEGQRERVGSDFLLQVPTNDERTLARNTALGLLQTINPNATINPGLDAILAFYPVSDVSNIPSVVRDKNNGNNFIVKVDHSFSNKEQLTGRYAFAQSDQVFPFGSPGGFGTGSRLPQFAQTSPARVQVVSVSLLSTLSDSKINEVRFGYSRYRTSFSDLNANFDPTTIGLNFGTNKLGLPEFDFTGVENLGAIGFSVPRGRTSGTYQILDNLTWSRGKQTLKFGGEFRRAAIRNFNDNVERGIFQFTAGNGFDPDPVVDSLVNFYTGGAFDTNFDYFVLVDQGNTLRTTYNNGFSFFVQDDYRATSNLTLNLGLRWEYFGPLSEKNNLLSNLAPDGTLAMVGTHGLDGLYERDLHDFGPRVGFAWNFRNDTVLRGAYGVYFDYVPQHLLIANFTSSAGVATNPIGPLPVVPLSFNSSVFNGLDTTPGATIMGPFGGPDSIFITPHKFHSPYVQNWNLNVQQKIAQNGSFELGYVGSKGTKLVRLTDLNEPDASGNDVRPNPGFENINSLMPAASSIYHGLQSTLRIQNAHGVSGFATYNWSKAIDDASDGIDFAPGVAFPQDPSNLKAERGPSSFDTKHRFTVAINYDLPSWTALKTFGSGWQLNWIASLQSGRPIPIITASDTSGRFYFNQRPNVVPGISPILPHWTPFTGYLNPLAFQQPDFGTFGNLGRNSVYGSGYRDLDFSITKQTQLAERVGLQFRVEFFNILNHPNFAQPDHNVTPGPGTAGLITQTPDVAQTNPGLGGGGPRVIQLGLKFNF